MLSKEKKEDIDNVYKYFMDEAKRRRPRTAITKSIDRTAAALKLPKSTVFSILLKSEMRGKSIYHDLLLLISFIECDDRQSGLIVA